MTMVLATSFNVDQEHCICNVDPDFSMNYFGSALPVPMDDLLDLDLSWSPPNGEIRLDDTCLAPMDFRGDYTPFSGDYSAIEEGDEEGSFANCVETEEGSLASSAQSGDCYATGGCEEELELTHEEGSFANCVKIGEYYAIGECKEELECIDEEGSFGDSVKIGDYSAIGECEEELELVHKEGSFANRVKIEDHSAIIECKEEVELLDEEGSSTNNAKFEDSSANKVEIGKFSHVPDFSGDFALKGSSCGGIGWKRQLGRGGSRRPLSQIEEGSFANCVKIEDHSTIKQCKEELALIDEEGSFANNVKFEDSSANKVKTGKFSCSPDFAEKGSSGRKRRRSPRGGGMRRCSHCEAVETQQWREGPSGPRTLCNACGVRYKTGRLVAQYRPAKSPSFDVLKHSNFHKRIMKKKKKGMDRPDLTYWVL